MFQNIINYKKKIISSLVTALVHGCKQPLADELAAMVVAAIQMYIVAIK